VQNNKLSKTIFWLIIFIGYVISFIGGCMVGRIIGRPLLSKDSKGADYYSATTARSCQLERYYKSLEQSNADRGKIIDSISAENQKLRSDKDRLGNENKELRGIRDEFEKLKRERQTDYIELENNAARIEQGFDEMESILTSP